MYFFLSVTITIFLHNFDTSYGDNIKDIPKINVEAKDILESFLITIGEKGQTERQRIKDLRGKLAKIDSYVIDKDKYAELILNATKRNDLNSTNFYHALVEEDYFKVFNNDTRNLYIKLKERMNRNDIFSILSERGEGKVLKSARRMAKSGFKASRRHEQKIDEIVDKYIGEKPSDNHKYNEEDKYSKYWDPQPALEEQMKAKASGRRLFKGERTTIRYYPFVVSVHVMGRFWCGGSIYWSDLIITSASCLQLMHNNRFFRENPRSLKVRVGSNHSRVSGELIEALEVFFHPAYNPKTLNNNIALIRLVRKMKFSYHRVPKIIKISTNEMGVAFTGQVLLLGWGVTKLKQKLAFEPIFLQAKELPVYPNKMCKEVYGDKFVQRTMFCAGTLTTGEGACDHDAGGPAVMNGKLVGIISFGPALCGYPNTPTVFTLVGAYADWIETVNETMPSYYRSPRRTTTTTESPILRYLDMEEWKNRPNKPSKINVATELRKAEDQKSIAEKVKADIDQIDTDLLDVAAKQTKEGSAVEAKKVYRHRKPKHHKNARVSLMETVDSSENSIFGKKQ